MSAEASSSEAAQANEAGLIRPGTLPRSRSARFIAASEKTPQMGVLQQSLDEKGALLMEVMISVIIMAVGLVAIIQSMVSAQRAAFTAEGYAGAVMAAENARADFLQQTFSPVNLPAKDNISTDYQVSQVTGRGFDALERLKTAEVDIRWQQGLKEKRTVFSTMVFEPPDTTLDAAGK